MEGAEVLAVASSSSCSCFREEEEGMATLPGAGCCEEDVVVSSCSSLSEAGRMKLQIIRSIIISMHVAFIYYIYKTDT